MRFFYVFLILATIYKIECQLESDLEKCQIVQVMNKPAFSFFNCENISSLNIEFDGATSIFSFRLIPREKLIFDATLNLGGLDNLFQDNYEVYLENFKGFNFKDNPFKFISKQGGILDLSDLELVSVVREKVAAVSALAACEARL